MEKRFLVKYERFSSQTTTPGRLIKIERCTLSALSITTDERQCCREVNSSTTSWRMSSVDVHGGRAEEEGKDDLTSQLNNAMHPVQVESAGRAKPDLGDSVLAKLPAEVLDRILAQDLTAVDHLAIASTCKAFAAVYTQTVFHVSGIGAILRRRDLSRHQNRLSWIKTSGFEAMTNLETGY